MASERMTVARAMVKALEAEGITTVFGYPVRLYVRFMTSL